MKIEREALDSYGGRDAFAGRVADFAAALAEHALTVGVPAPIEAEAVEIMARAPDGWEAALAGLEVIEPAAPSAASSRMIAPLDLRRRFSPASRAAVTSAAWRDLGAGDASLQVFLDDLASAGLVSLDDPELAAGFALLVARGLITEAERAELLA